MTDWLTLAISGWHRCLHPCARTPTAFATIMWSRETGVALPLPSGDGWNSSPRSCWGRRSVPMTTTLSAMSCEGSATSWPDWADKMSTRPSFYRLQLFLPCLWPWVTLSDFVRPRMCLSLSCRPVLRSTDCSFLSHVCDLEWPWATSCDLECV